MIYGAWAFIAWMGSILVTDRGNKGGNVFIAGLMVLWGAL